MISNKFIGSARYASIILVVACAFFSTTAVRAETLIDALGRTYLNNPSLQAGRAKLRAVDEQVPQALAAMRPTVNVVTEDQRSKTNDNFHNSSGGNSRAARLEVTQPIYHGGRIQAGISGAQNRVLAERASLLSTEQTILLSAATAYMDVVRDQLSLDLIANYQKILENRFEIEKRRRTIGENTKTDVSQAEARLAEAIAQRLQAEAALRASASEYLRVTGAEPKSLSPPRITLEIPNDLNEIVEAARNNNPDIIVARYSERSARNDVEAIDGELLPSVDAVGSVSRTWNTSSTLGRVDSVAATLRMTLPIDNGSVSARARGARQTVSQMMQEAENAERTATHLATRSWSLLVALRAEIRAREAVIRSVNETLRSMRTEVNIGSRTVTDLLNSEQEALSSQLSLILAKHDEVVLSFTLLSAIGRLTAQAIRLPVERYDYEKHYQRVRGKVWGVSLASDPK